MDHKGTEQKGRLPISRQSMQSYVLTYTSLREGNLCQLAGLHSRVRKKGWPPPPTPPRQNRLTGGPMQQRIQLH